MLCWYPAPGTLQSCGQGGWAELCKKHELQLLAHATIKGSALQESPTSSLHRQIPPRHTARPCCLSTLTWGDQACDLVLKSRPSPTRGISTPARYNPPATTEAAPLLSTEILHPATTLQRATSHDCLRGFFKMPQDFGRFFAAPPLDWVDGRLAVSRATQRFTSSGHSRPASEASELLLTCHRFGHDPHSNLDR